MRNMRMDERRIHMRVEARSKNRRLIQSKKEDQTAEQKKMLLKIRIQMWIKMQINIRRKMRKIHRNNADKSA